MRYLIFGKDMKKNSTKSILGALQRFVAMACAFCVFQVAMSQAKIHLRGGGEMYYEEYGEGVPVLLIHGHTLDRRMWAEQVELLKDSFHVIVPDLRGYGLSSDPKEGYQFTHLDDMIALMDSLQIGKAHVIGLSMGAYVAGDMVSMHPERLLSCMMVSGEPCRFYGPSRPRSAKEIAQRRADILKVKKDVEGYKRNRIEDLLKECFEGNVERIRPILTEEIMDWRAWQALHVTGRVYYGLDAWAKLRQKKPAVPALIIYGAKETTEQSPALEFLPNGRQLIFDDCGHMVNLEQPELFNQTLLEWLEENK